MFHRVSPSAIRLAVIKRPISPQSSRNSVTGSASEPNPGRQTRLERRAGFWLGSFRAMASPCEVLVDGEVEAGAQAVLDAVAMEAWRVEDKYSRYRTGNIVHAINTSGGRAVVVDDESAGLLDFSAQLYSLSEGHFDITSGVLRRAWKFDGGTHIPAAAEIEALRELVGWRRVSWNRPSLAMPAGMEIDFGGICKEYAVDRAAGMARELHTESVLVNFGGDLAVSRPRLSGLPWRVGVETSNAGHPGAAKMIDLRQGALATSGDTYRYMARDGKRYTHILDPRTGCPVENAPRSVTVAASTCTQAGMLTTLALLQGGRAEQFLNEAGAQCWVQR
jgi:thiamine biosynthesis lipoprotein